jgi:hypothetical protein
MKLTRESGLTVLFVTAAVSLSTCLVIHLAAPVSYAQETETVLKPDQLVTFSLAPEQEKLFLLQMKKGDFADIQSLAREGLNLSLKIYDSTRKELLEKSDEGGDSIWFVAPREGDFLLVTKLEKSTERSGSEKISIQYNNKLKVPPGTRLKGIRRMNGFEVKIMATPGERDSGSILIITKNGQLQKAMKGPEYGGFYFADDNTSAFHSAKEIQLIRTTPDKTGNGIPDIMIDYFSGGAHCCFATYFFDLGDSVKLSDILVGGDSQITVIGRNPKGGLTFGVADYVFAYWLTSFATSPGVAIVMEFKNGKLRPSFDLMRKPAPALAVLKNKAEFYRQRLTLRPYRGDENYDYSGSEDPFYRQETYPNNADEKYKGVVYRNVVFWGPMLDLIYSGNEELAWQFLDLVWPPQKQGKALFIRDFKKKLLESEYWKMILADKEK